jgi:hypothetical protein
VKEKPGKVSRNSTPFVSSDGCRFNASGDVAGGETVGTVNPHVSSNGGLLKN